MYSVIGFLVSLQSTSIHLHVDQIIRSKKHILEGMKHIRLCLLTIYV